ncbi:nitroreductase family protein [Lactobacillus sp. ESL0684]|uniref:nitroreductase family protein n=1 Tax=Lactobacillus sp. ESL0684 TaxID=2983213 RepID=UPI0023F7C14B|nr:nitroreductase family protein [Lactobacillus sp. ESL0684]WEV44402.1 nitroreductase family protein [Lactobacillus sp. ESL0684]
MTNPILKRVAVRKYTSEKVDSEAVDHMIAAFQAAPCGMHETDVMQLTVVEDDQLLQQIERATDNACYDAPLLFVINVKKDRRFGQRDASCAAENIMIEATSLDLGSIYTMSGATGLNAVPELQEQISSPGYETCVIVAVGHSAEFPTEDRSHRYHVIRK